MYVACVQCDVSPAASCNNDIYKRLIDAKNVGSSLYGIKLCGIFDKHNLNSIGKLKSDSLVTKVSLKYILFI